MDLATLIEAATHAEATSRKDAVRAALAGADASPDLAELEQAAASAFGELAQPGESGYSEDTVAQMQVYADTVEALRDAAAEQQRAQQQAEQVADLTSRVGQPQITTPAAEPTPPSGSTGQQEQPPAPAAEPAPADEPTSGGGTPQQSGNSPGADDTPAAVVSSRTPQSQSPQVPLDGLPKQLPAEQKADVSITAAADIPNFPMGSILNGIDGLTQAAMARFSALDRAGRDTSAGIAVIERYQPDEKLIADNPNDWSTIEYACDESRLPGGSLTAAADWCAIPEHTYDQFCPVPVIDGLVSLPTVTARRGGLSWPKTPKFSDIYTGTGFFMPDEEMRKGEEAFPTGRRDKPCYIVPCTDNQSLVLDVYGLCVKVPILMERAYPELVNHTIQQIMAAHAHKMNAVTLEEMDALVPAANRKTFNQATTPVTATDPVAQPYGPGATASLLGIIELQVEYLRYKYRLGINTSMELVIPVFVRGILRSDLAKRRGVDMLNVTDQQLDAYLRSRSVNPQYVLDWQDAFAGARDGYDPGGTSTEDGTWLPTYDGTLWGGDTPPDTWPNQVKFLLYPAGTYFKATNDIISIDGMYDSSLLARNMHLALFTEEGMKVGLRGCYDPMAITVTLCADGRDGGNLPDVAFSCPSA